MKGINCGTDLPVTVKLVIDITTNVHNTGHDGQDLKLAIKGVHVSTKRSKAENRKKMSTFMLTR